MCLAQCWLAIMALLLCLLAALCKTGHKLLTCRHNPIDWAGSLAAASAGGRRQSVKARQYAADGLRVRGQQETPARARKLKALRQLYKASAWCCISGMAYLPTTQIGRQAAKTCSQ